MEQDYQEIDLIELIQKILKFWWLLAIAAILCGSLAFYVTKNHITPVYEAKTTLFIGKEAGAIAELSLNELNVGNKLVTDYRELIKTNRVLETVIKDLKLATTAEILRDKIEVSTVNDSRFIYASVQDPSPQMAVAIADKVSEILKEKAEEIVGARNVYIVDVAKLPVKPVSPSTMKNTAIAMILGVMVALLIIFLNMMLNNTVEKDEDIEKAIGIPVIGTIPQFKGEPRK